MHLLQSSPWSAFKSQFGWSSRTVSLANCRQPTQVLFRRLPLGFNLAYVPKGPDIEWQDQPRIKQVLLELRQVARQKRTIFLKVEPDIAGDPTLEEQFFQTGFVKGKAIQPVTTIIVDITPTEEGILAAMKSKTRYNIRLARKKGVVVQEGTLADLNTFYHLSQITARRDGFGIHPLSYYQAAFDQFPAENRALLLAYYESQPLAGLMVFAWDSRAYYLYGASSDEHRDKMPTYLLQWEAIRWAKARGCHTYDLWGIPDLPLETLEAEFTNRSDGLWGVYRFKRGFGGQVTHSLGAFDYVYNAPLYYLFTKILEWRSG